LIHFYKSISGSSLGGLRLIVGDRPNAEEIPKSLIVDLMADQPYLGQPGSM